MNVGIVACGAIATHINSVQERYGLDITIYPLPPLLHNSPKKIAGGKNEGNLLFLFITGVLYIY